MMKSIVDIAKDNKIRFVLSAVILGLTLITAIVLPVVAHFDSEPQTPRFIQHIDGFQPQYDLDARAVSTIYISDGFYASPGFSSHLPLVVIDTGGVEIPQNRRWTDYGFMEMIPGVEPYVDSRVYIFDSGERNRLTDTPVTFSRADVRRRGNTSMLFEKGQYKIELRTETGQRNYLSILGMHPDRDWVLRGSLIDSSLMRDYLALTTAYEVIPFTPQGRFVEVFFRENGYYMYNGVYLLAQNVKQGPGRVELDNRRIGDKSSFIIRRDRYDVRRPMLDTWATRYGLTYGYLAVFYPRGNDLTEGIHRFIEEEISALEQVLFSDDPNIFLTYRYHINVDSFVDYFLINEFFGNYDAGFHSTYFYRDLLGKISVGPVWDFDLSIDNYRDRSMRLMGTSFSPASWFDRLVLHNAFVEQLISRYREFRRGPLCPDRIETLVYETALFIRPAQQRDWKRWGHVYTNASDIWALIGYDPNELDVLPLDPFELLIADVNISFAAMVPPGEEADVIFLQRHTFTFEQEITKLQYTLRTHGDFMLTALRDYLLDEGTVMISTDDEIISNSLQALVFIVIFLSSIILVDRTVKG